MVDRLSSLAIPAVIVLTALVILFRKKDSFDLFLEGARAGLGTTVSLLPTMILLTVSLSMLSASGLVDVLSGWIAPLTARIGIPAELLPLLLTRPVSGSASTATFIDLVERYGADSLPGLCASILMGSSDTLIYVIGVYFSAVGVKNTRHTVPVALFVMVVCILLSCAAARFFFFR